MMNGEQGFEVAGVLGGDDVGAAEEGDDIIGAKGKLRTAGAGGKERDKCKTHDDNLGTRVSSSKQIPFGSASV